MIGKLLEKAPPPPITAKKMLPSKDHTVSTKVICGFMQMSRMKESKGNYILSILSSSLMIQ